MGRGDRERLNTMDKPKDVFLCHSSTDRTFANRLAKDLQSAGLTVWLDEAEIKVGDSLISKITSGIHDSEFVVAILSPAAVSSSWVKYELKTAMNLEIHEKRVKVLPIIYQNCDLPEFILDKRYLTFTTDEHYGKSLHNMISSIKDYIFQMGEHYLEIKIREIGGEYIRHSDEQGSISRYIQLPDHDSSRRLIAIQLKIGAIHLIRETPNFVRIRLQKKEIITDIATIIVWMTDNQPDRYALWQSTTVANPRTKTIKITKRSVFDPRNLPKLLELARNWTGRPNVPMLKSRPLGLTCVRDVCNAAWKYYSGWRHLGSHSPKFGRVDVTLKAWRHITRVSSPQQEIIHKLSLLPCAKELIERTNKSTIFWKINAEKELYLLKGLCSTRYREDILVEVILEVSKINGKIVSTKLYSVHERRGPW